MEFVVVLDRALGGRDLNGVMNPGKFVDASVEGGGISRSPSMGAIDWKRVLGAGVRAADSARNHSGPNKTFLNGISGAPPVLIPVTYHDGNIPRW